MSFGNLRIRADGAAEAAKAAGRRPLRGVTGVDGALRLSAGNGAKEKKGRIICTRRHCSAREIVVESGCQGQWEENERRDGGAEGGHVDSEVGAVLLSCLAVSF